MLISLLTAFACVSAIVICLVSGGFTGFGWVWMLPLGFLGSFLALLALTALVVWAICQPIDTSKPRNEDSPFHRKMANEIVAALITLFRVRFRTQGLEKTPKEGRFFLVCNHMYIADPVVLLHFFKNSQLAFISKKENNSMPIVGKLMHALLCQCIDRENDRAALKTILECIRLLKEDKCSIAVFPEGGTNHDNRLHPFRPGVFKIAQKAKVPIVVCTVEGTRDIFSNARRLMPTEISLHLIDVIPPEEFEGQKTTEISDRVWEMMKNDLSEPYQPL